MNEEEIDLPRPQRWPLVLAALVTLLWLALIVILGVALGQPGSIAGALGVDASALTIALAIITIAAMPVALLWLIAVQLRDRTGTRTRQAVLLTAQLQFADRNLSSGDTAMAALESRLEALFARIETLSIPVAAHAAALDDAAARLDASNAGLGAAAAATLAASASLADATPAAHAQVTSLAALLEQTRDKLGAQLADTETLLAALWSRLTDASAAASTASAVATVQIDSLTTAAKTAHAALSAPILAISEGADAAFSRTAAAADATRDGVHAQTSALLASVEQARVTFDHIGSESSRQIGDRITTMLGAADTLTAQIEAQSDRYRILIEQVERGFAVLDAKLGNSVATGNNALESIAVRMTDARDAIYKLGEPIAATDAALVAVEQRLADLDATTTSALGTIGMHLPAALPQVAALTTSLADLHASAAALAAPISGSGAAIAAAESQLELARRSLDGAAVTLASELASARATLGDIEMLTGSASLAASTQLIDVFGRIRDVASQTAGTMRETLAAVVSEAESALEHAGTSRAESAFAVPIRAQLADIELANTAAANAAQSATERVTQRLLALTQTIATVEARIDESDAHYDMRLRDDIAKRSAALLDSLKEGAIDISKLLSIDVDDNSWARYLRGDKGVFARRAVRLIDSGTARAIARLYQHDPVFAEQATRYITEFEMLIARVLPDREGKSLAVTLLSSDVGKLYVALAQGTERLR